MFVRKEHKKSGVYLSICKTYRNSQGKVCQEHIRSLGKISDYKPEMLRQIGQRLYQLGGGDIGKLRDTFPQELSRHNYGFPYVLRKLLLDFKFDLLFNRIERRFKISYDTFSIFLLLLCDRFYDPSSKSKSFELQDEYVGISKVKLHHIYRSLEKLSYYKLSVQNQIYQSYGRLGAYQLDVVFYDVTTFYFDSEVEHPEAKARKGFGKDGKIGKTQVVFGMLIDQHKNPVAYEVYSGNKYEGHTLSDALLKLKQKYHIGKVVVVADRGMMNKDNINLFQEGGLLADYEYIIGERLKNLPKKIKEHLTNLANYTTYDFEDESGEDIVIQCCRYKYKDKIIIGTFSKKRAKKDRMDRERRIEKAKKLNTSQLHKKAKWYFLKANEEQNFVLDENRIKQAARFDGFMAVTTSDEGLSDLQIIQQYKNLYQIEHSFRTFKSYLEIRPMFHWNDKRIEGHICLCYIAYCLLNYLQQQLKAQQLPYSENAIRKMLANMQVSKVKIEDYEYFMKSNISDNEVKLLKILGLHNMIDFMPIAKMDYYFQNVCSGKLKKLSH